MKLNEFMITEVIQAAPDETIGVAARRMREWAVGCLVVTLAGAVKGIITDRDLLGCLAEQHDPNRCQVAAHMHRPVIVLDPDEDHATAAEVLRERRIKRLPIAKAGKLLGIVSLSDLAAIAEEEAKKLLASLNFFNSVVRAQSRQNIAPSDSARIGKPVGTTAAALNNGARNDSLDVGGPG